VKILLDENIPVQLRGALPHHQVGSVNDSSVGWKNIYNGRLLAEMEGRYDLLITADRNIYAQQNLSGRSISILVLPTNRRNDVLNQAARIAEIVGNMSAGQYAILEKSGECQIRSLNP
jgi:predicted nuclease of predicted toxin-antitoxin system